MSAESGETNSVAAVSFQDELVRLQNELDNAINEKIQAAQHGLALLEENCHLKHSLEESESNAETLKHELDMAKKALQAVSAQQRRQAQDGEAGEETLLSESASREGALQLRIGDLEAELRALSVDQERRFADMDRLAEEAASLAETVRSLEAEKRSLRSEVKELKSREARQLADHAELADENMALERKLLEAQRSQLDYELVKHERRRLLEETEILSGQLEELARLRAVSDKNLEEAQDALQAEREAKHSLRRELDTRLSADSLQQFSTSVQRDLASTNANSHDLYSELAGQLRERESEREAARRRAEEAEATVERLRRELQTSRFEHDQALDQLRVAAKLGQADSDAAATAAAAAAAAAASHGPPGGPADLMSQSVSELSEFRGPDEAPVKRYASLEHKYLVALRQIAALQRDLNRMRSAQELQQRPDDAARLVAAQADLELVNSHLRAQLEETNASVATATERCGRTVAELRLALAEFGALYLQLCQRAGQEPQRRLADLIESRGGSGGTGNGSVAMETALDELASQADCLRLLRRHLADVAAAAPSAASTTEAAAASAAEQREEAARLRALMNTKREQIATLRSVLKTNKATAESALANLKQKYQNEKQVVSETMLRLRSELKSLKDDAAGFANLRNMFGQRCEEYVTQIDEMQRQLQAADEERKTLNSLLRMAIQQKLTLTQRLEEMEMDNERLRRLPPVGVVTPGAGGGIAEVNSSSASGRSSQPLPPLPASAQAQQPGAGGGNPQQRQGASRTSPGSKQPTHSRSLEAASDSDCSDDYGDADDSDGATDGAGAASGWPVALRESARLKRAASLYASFSRVASAAELSNQFINIPHSEFIISIL
ncbi:hypothetical protein BOX15_Mlig000232g2 [Macrostomum lignano]|uniref:Protein bicaudal D n=1 Tax=Macrostomum lignano TaxID=282301 RepID=A0A267E033_9PLAT|nr:hypothetical protein BOX15_Mlig000232g2 [Macrostomum lignano]